MEDFEDSGNLAKWTIKNEGNRGWLWQKNEKYKEPYAGNYSMRLLEAWEDIHQDEYLISPVFANGKSLLSIQNLQLRKKITRRTFIM